MDIRQLRARILGSMGIPAVMLAGACSEPVEAQSQRDPAPAQEFDPADPIDPVDPVDEEPEQPEEPAPPPFLVELSTFEVQRIATVTVTGGGPNAELWVVWSGQAGQNCAPIMGGGCVDLNEPQLLVGGTTDEHGAAELQVLLPRDWAAYDDAPFLIQAATLDGDGNPATSELLESAFSMPLRQCFPVDEMHPDLTAADIWDMSGWLVCEPRPDDGICEAAANFDAWRASELFASALGEPLPPNWTVSALCDETSTEDCCWAMQADDVNLGNGNGGNDGGGGWAEGRPFTVENAPRHAPAANSAWSEPLLLEVGQLPASVRAEAAARWAAVGAAEHASVASFSRFNLELLALGAPASLLERATSAIRDEIAHARVAYAVASAYAGQPVGPGPLPIEGALDRSDDPARVLVAAILEGCINETVSAALAQHAAERAADPALAGPMRQVAEDETRHAELSWAFVAWMLGERAELRALASAAFDSYRMPKPGPESDLSRHGLLSGAEQHVIAQRILREVVRPCADTLLGREREVMA